MDPPPLVFMACRMNRSSPPPSPPQYRHPCLAAALVPLPPSPPLYRIWIYCSAPPPSSPHALTLYSWLRIWICCTLEGCSSLMRISWGEVGHLEGGEGGKA